MSVTAERKREVIQEYAREVNDSGSCEVQVAVLTTRIENLIGHFQNNPKDNHSRRGLLQMVSKRRKLLDYLKRTDASRYRALIGRLGLRK